MTETIDDVFQKALAKDAGVSEPPEVPAPPLKDPAAPHGRDEAGAALAPYGVKADGTPRLKPAGPGRPKADAPRVTTLPAPQGGTRAAGKPDYSGQLAELADTVWVAGSSLKGGRLLFLPLPDCRPYAAVWHQATPNLVVAWNAAAQQNETVRGYVEKLSGEGSWSWVLGVAIATAGLVGACTELAKAAPEVRAQAAAVNDANMQAYVKAQVEAMGMQVQEAA